MAEVNIGKAAAFADPGRKVIDVGGYEVGVFHLGQQFYAYLNSCPHLDGPACQGILLPCATEAVDEADMTSEGRVYSKTQLNVVCPWHGFEFDIRTGEHPTKKSVRLKKVGIRVEGGDVLVQVPNRK